MRNRRIGLVNRDSYYDKDRAFDNSLSYDYITYGWVELREMFDMNSCSFETIESLEQAKRCDILLFNEYPNHIEKLKFLDLSVSKFLLLYESPLIVPDNYKVEKHSMFSRVFTWSEDLIKLDPNFYIKINFGLPINRLLIEDNIKERKKGKVLVAGNKLVRGRGELYSYRQKLIDHYENSERTDFDLFGANWDAYRMSSHNYFGKGFNRLTRSFKKTPPSNWRGKVNSKMDLYKEYKFSYAIENAHDLPGYITEKILHSLLSLTVPLYLGDRTIEKYIPQDLYIDIEGMSFSEIDRYCDDISTDDLRKMRKSIYSFISEGGLKPFDTKTNASILCENVL
jgi:hypothetical protein